MNAMSGASVNLLQVDEDEDGMRVDRWFKRRLPDLALSHLNKICRKGEVRVDGKRVDTSTRLKVGQTVRVPPLRLEPKTPAVPARPVASASDRRALRDMTVFEDRYLMVLNKPYGLAVQGGSGLRHHLDGMLEALADEAGERPRLVHRLDRDTAGLLLVAKTRRMAADLGEIFRSRQARKIYWALVVGVPRPAQGRISLFLAKGEAASGPGLERMRVVRQGEDQARHSVTYYAVVDKIPARVAWLSMKPVTGRTHQLRAHAEAIGHPILGDPKYGRLAANDPRLTDPLRAVPSGVEPKLHLLARRLILPHPKGGDLDLSAPLPEHMRNSFETFGFDAKHYDPIESSPDE
jgi:23S rRNA pseudouridine955/2504/2580 synthase